jgi:hypothetical protein
MASSSKTELLLLTKLVLAKNAAQVAAAAANVVVIVAVAVVASAAVAVASVAAVVVVVVAVADAVATVVTVAPATNTILNYLSKKRLPVLDRKTFFYAFYTLDLFSLCHGGLCSNVLSN